MNPTAQHVLQVRDLRVRFPGLLTVRDVSFSLAPGDLLGLIGPNGAGKTTLLRAIAGLQPMTRGHVSILGQKLSTDAMRWIGFTPDVPAVYDNLTVRNFLMFIAKGYDLSTGEANERIDFWLEKVWLKEKASQKIKALSRGMKQRIGIARTLLPNPALVLLDEPAAGLDPAGRVQFRQLLMDLRAQGKTLIVSSHILSDMSEYCSHIGIMDHGALRHFGTVAELVAGQDNSRCRYCLVIARPMTGLAEMLAEIPLITNIAMDRDRMVFEYPAQIEAAAELLADLIRKNIPVASFAPLASNLEEAYLRIGIGQVD